MGNYLLDTNVLIRALRRDLNVLNWLDAVGSEQPLHTSVISRTEVFAGMHPHEEQITTDFLASLISLPVNESTADLAGRMIYNHAHKGFQVSLPDALIAATALEHDLTLVTANVKHFSTLGKQLIALSDVLSPGEA